MSENTSCCTPMTIAICLWKCVKDKIILDRKYSDYSAVWIIAYCFYLRPGEMLSLTTDDVILPEFHVYAQRSTGYVVLGLRTRGTKVKRAQTADSDNKFGIACLRFLYSHTPPGGNLLNNIRFCYSNK